LEVAPGTVIDPDSIRRLIKNEGKVKAVAVFHNVTSTGVTNPVDEIGKITAENNVLLLVDAISSAEECRLKLTSGTSTSAAQQRRKRSPFQRA
jgi:aspartate aminotransferase-like enzyme